MKLGKIGKWLLIVVATAMVVFVGLCVGGYIWINKYLSGEAFRAQVSQAVSGALGVKGEFEPFRWQGLSVYTPGFNATGAPSSSVDRLDLREIHADIGLSAALHGKIEIPLLEIGQVLLSLKEVPPPSSAAVPDVPEAKKPEPAPATTSSGSSDTVAIGTVRVAAVNMTWPKELGGGGSVSSLAVVAKNADGRMTNWNVDARGGILVVALLPQLHVEQFTLRLNSGRLYLTKSEFRNTPKGTVTASGEVGLGAFPDLDVQVNVAAFPLTPLLPDDWRDKLRGDLDSSFRLTRAGEANAPWKIEGKASLGGASLTGLPFQGLLALALQNPSYKNLQFQTASTDFTIGPSTREARNLVLESQGCLRVENGRIVDDVAQADALDGTLQLGIPPANLGLIPGAKSQVFTEDRDNYAWTPVRITGTVADVKEDLTGRLTTAAFGAVQEGVQKNADKILDGAQKVLNGLFK